MSKKKLYIDFSFLYENCSTTFGLASAVRNTRGPLVVVYSPKFLTTTKTLKMDRCPAKTPPKGTVRVGAHAIHLRDLFDKENIIVTKAILPLKM